MLLVVGHVGKPHGVRGEVLVTVRTDEPEARFVAGSVFTTQVRRDRRVSTGPAAGRSGAVPVGPVKPVTPVDRAGADRAGADRAGADRVGAEPVPDGLPPLPGVPETLTLESLRWHQGRIIAVFDGFYDRDGADRLRGVELCVDSAEVAPPDDPDEFNDHQLVGLAVETVDGEQLGDVLRIDHAPASDLIVLRRPDGKTALIPFVRQIVPEVDVAGGKIVVDPPVGLLDL
jgi:16S rRNA processing protein RimM